MSLVNPLAAHSLLQLLAQVVVPQAYSNVEHVVSHSVSRYAYDLTYRMLRWEDPRHNKLRCKGEEIAYYTLLCPVIMYYFSYCNIDSVYTVSHIPTL